MSVFSPNDTQRGLYNVSQIMSLLVQNPPTTYINLKVKTSPWPDPCYLSAPSHSPFAHPLLSAFLLLLDAPGLLLPLGLCTCWSICPECSSPRNFWLAPYFL